MISEKTKSYVYKSWRKQTPIICQPYTLVGGLPGVDSKQLTLGMSCRAAEGLEAKGDQGEGNLWWDVEILWIDQLSGTCPSCPKIWLVWNNVTRYQKYSRVLLQYLNSHWNSFHFEFYLFSCCVFLHNWVDNHQVATSEGRGVLPQKGNRSNGMIPILDIRTNQF